jgi:hypothetical protein
VVFWRCNQRVTLAIQHLGQDIDGKAEGESDNNKSTDGDSQRINQTINQ